MCVAPLVHCSHSHLTSVSVSAGAQCPWIPTGNSSVGDDLKRLAACVAAGNRTQSGLAAAAGSLMLLAIATGVVCVLGAVWRRVRNRMMQRPVSTLSSHLQASDLDQFDG